MIRFILCLFLLCSYSLRSNSPKDLKTFFDATKIGDYKTALAYTNQLNDDDYKEALVYLIQLLEKKSNSSKVNINPQNTDVEYKILAKLISGYEFLNYKKVDNLQAFKEFSIALRRSQKIKNTVLEKASLLAILNVFSTEIFIGSKVYLVYLDRFKELRSDSADEVNYIFNNLIFDSKESEMDGLQVSYFRMMDKLDSIFYELPKSHPLYRKYYFEKGIQYKVTNPEKAINFFLKADSLTLLEPNLIQFKGTVAWQLSSLNLINDSIQKAKIFLNAARNLSKTLKDDFYNDRLASVIFQKEGNYDSAYHYLRKSVDIEYELGYKNNTLESSILTVQNQTDKLKLDKLELEATNKTSRNFVLIMAILLLLGTIIGILTFKNTKRKQLLAEQEKTLEQQKVSNLLKEQELTTIDAMIEGQEKERQRVANELHDDLGSLMAAVKLQFNSLEASDKKGNLETFAKTESLIDEAYSKIRAIAHAKNSGLIAKQGLLPAVNQMAEKVSVASGISIMVHDHGLDTRLENSMELTLFRIIQELMANVIKHAAATEMNIHITNHGDTLNILAEDNGKGMAAKAVKTSAKGMGLKSIDKRINHLHGSMDIESEIGKGTVIILDIPI